jgi:DNA-directed RNA polymerase specialized sigma24 family protein
MVPVGGRSLRVPTPQVVERVRRMLFHRNRLQPADVEDVISQSMVDFLSAPANPSSNDGLFLVIARRRAADLLRGRARERSLSGGRPLTVLPERSHLERELLARAIRRYASEKNNLDATRLLAVAVRVLDGSSFSQACRESGIPRGSQSRYRKTLREFLDRLLRRGRRSI